MKPVGGILIRIEPALRRWIGTRQVFWPIYKRRGGLAITLANRTALRADDPPRYAITHVRSGLKIGSLIPFWAARMFFRALLSAGMDWRAEAHEIVGAQTLRLRFILGWIRIIGGRLG